MKLTLTTISTIVLLATSSCSGGTPPEGKWLDYGGGLVNLSQVSNIISDQSEPADITFDQFKLRVGKFADMEKAMEQIRAFLKSNDSYMKLELK